MNSNKKGIVSHSKRVHHGCVAVFVTDDVQIDTVRMYRTDGLPDHKSLPPKASPICPHHQPSRLVPLTVA
eukprot:1159722-Pelagomonas_calceolata.AAC.3